MTAPEMVECPCCHGSGECRVCHDSGQVKLVNLLRAREPGWDDCQRLLRWLTHEPMFTDKDAHDGD